MVETTRYKCVLMDPPWPERGGGKCKRGADRHYPIMSIREIKWTTFEYFYGGLLANREIRVDIDGCHLWIWATNNHMPCGVELMRHLGFRYITNIAWVKVKNDRLQKGLGQYTRGCHELLLFGVKGRAMIPETYNRPPTVLFAERTKHSQKPKEAYELIEKVSPGPRLEMFARNTRIGWDNWGNESPPPV